MYYSLTFVSIDDDTVRFNTFDDFKLAPESRPLVNPPEVYTKYISSDILSGDLDLTTILSRRPTYKNRTGDWTFYVLNGLFDNANYAEWFVRYEDIIEAIHGKKFKVYLEDDTEYYYIARLAVKEWKSQKDYSKITITYTADPYKYPVSTDTDEFNWKWNELFSNVIYYGEFSVTGHKMRNLIDPEDIEKSVTITTTSGITVEFSNGDTEVYGVGTTENAFTINPGNNIMKFSGEGSVTISYEKGPIL